MNLTRNFTEKELACPCCGECSIDEVLLTKLQAFRDVVSIPLVITSGYRCLEHNRSVGGSLNSQHLKGKAVDIRINDKDAITRYKMIKAAFDLGFKGVGIGKNQFHLDVRDNHRKSWGY